MNRAILRRWLNEYLDGEIGLADKAEFERAMVEDPALREEYRQLRRIGLCLGMQPDVTVHPTRFRQKVLSALDSQERIFFTPQRAFAGAMLVALIIVGLTFGLILYQQQQLGGVMIASQPVEGESVHGGQPAYELALSVDASAEEFMTRVLLEAQIGMIDPAMLDPFLAQTRIYEGAVCTPGGGLNNVRFQVPLPHSLRVRVPVRNAQVLSVMAEEFSGHTEQLTAFSRDGRSLSFKEYMAVQPAGTEVYLTLHFQ